VLVSGLPSGLRPAPGSFYRTSRSGRQLVGVVAVAWIRTEQRVARGILVRATGIAGRATTLGGLRMCPRLPDLVL